jgi:hypothetical protein
MPSPRFAPAAGLSLAFLLAASARAEQPPAELETTPLVDVLRVELSLRAYAVYPKFRFRDGHVGRTGDSLRTQRIGLDNWTASPGGTAGLRLFGTEWFGVHGWFLDGGGEGVLTRDTSFRNQTLPRGTRVRTDYRLTYVALEYLHRFEVLGGLAWVDLGARLEYLEFRATVVGTDREKLEALWPSPRLHVGLRPLPWLELEARLGGFHLDFPVANTVVTQAQEVGGAIRFRLPASAFVELGGFLYHVHLEENPGEAREDVLHLRHRTLFVSLGVVF